MRTSWSPPTPLRGGGGDPRTLPTPVPKKKPRLRRKEKSSTLNQQLEHCLYQNGAKNTCFTHGGCVPNRALIANGLHLIQPMLFNELPDELMVHVETALSDCRAHPPIPASGKWRELRASQPYLPPPSC